MSPLTLDRIKKANGNIKITPITGTNSATKYAVQILENGVWVSVMEDHNRSICEQAVRKATSKVILGQMHEIPSGLYSQFHEKMPIICVDIVVNADDKILLVKRANEPEKGRWWFPGGRLLRGESLRAAAGRITKTEIGVTIMRPEYLGHGETVFETDPFGHNRGTHTVNFVFAARANALALMSVLLDANHIAYSTFTFEEIYGSNMHPYIKKFTALSEGVFRKQVYGII